MNKLLLLLFCSASAARAQLPAPWTFYPFAPAAGKSGSTAIHKDSASFVAWADGYTALAYGSDVDATWKTPAKALGKAVGDSYDIVCLGNGGTITLTFSTPIANGVGYDFAVFENSFSDTALELGWVEVSSDGTHFCRFPNYYGGSSPVGAFSGHSPTDIYGLASKYRQGYGTPFDLQELKNAWDAIQNGSATFLSTAYASSITANFPYLDLNNIGYVRIIDIVGDGKAKEATGRTIYDPYPTVGSGGFDLDAIGVINRRQDPERLPQSITFAPIPNQRLADGTVVLNASSDSGLPVSFTVTEGPATRAGATLTFTGSGTVVVTAAQPGDETYAPAASATRSFVVAEHVQHLYFAPVANLLQSQSFQLLALSSRGLPVAVEVVSGDGSVSASSLLTTGSAGFGGADHKTITLRAFQAGDAATAPAEDVYQDVKVVPNASPHAPQTFAQWCTLMSVTADATADADGDGFNTFEEFMAGTSPALPSEKPQRALALTTDDRGDRWCVLTFRIRRRSLASLAFEQCAALGAIWSTCVPQLNNMIFAEEAGVDFVELEIALPAEAGGRFFRPTFAE